MEGMEISSKILSGQSDLVGKKRETNAKKKNISNAKGQGDAAREEHWKTSIMQRYMIHWIRRWTQYARSSC